VDPAAIDSAQIADAVAVLRRGGLAAFPTETVYGLGADASREDAVARIYQAKGRPRSVPLIVHLASVAEVPHWAAAIPKELPALARRFWPGPLTLVVPALPRARPVAAGLPTVGLRVPDHPVALALLRAFGDGVAAPSANRFGLVSPTEAAHVRADLGAAVDLVLDGGPCRVGVESTVLDLCGDPIAVLRPGGVPTEEIEACLGRPVPVLDAHPGPHRSPGQSLSHYAPRARVVLTAASDAAATWASLPEPAGVLAGTPPGPAIPWIPTPEDPADYARVLYGLLREVDSRGWRAAAIVPPDPRGVGLAVQDRLRRAAATRG
jgi:L-threonylcarbamoyladenylate synthase